jgi:hypothetical protein
MTSLVLMAAYSAYLISSLAVQHRDLPFRDLQGLLHDGSYKLVVMRNSAEFSIFHVWGIKYLWPDYLVEWLRFMGETGMEWKHGVSSVFYSVITSKLTEVLNLSKSQKIILQYIISLLASMKTFYQRPFHNIRHHVEWY